MESRLAYHPWANAHELAAKILGKEIKQVLFEKTDPKDVRALYELARKEASGNSKALGLIEKLTAGFDARFPRVKPD